jgi:hypothetical protein
MASPTAPDRADVPLTGGYTRFELELEVRIRHGPYSVCFSAINTALVCAVPRESRLSQLPGHPEVLRQARVRGLPRLPAVLQRAQVHQISPVGIHRLAGTCLLMPVQPPWPDPARARAAAAGAIPAGNHHPRPHEQDAIRGPAECGAWAKRVTARRQVCVPRARQVVRAGILATGKQFPASVPSVWSNVPCI